MKIKLKKIISLITVFALVLAIPLNAFAMEIYVVITGEETLTLEVEPTDRIEDIRAQIQDKTGIAPEYQELSFSGKTLEDGNTLQGYSIQKESTITLQVLTPTDWADAADDAVSGTDYVLDNDKYTLEINTALGLAYFADQVNNQSNNYSGYTVTLTNDIDLLDAGVTGYSSSNDGTNNWTAIGTAEYPFKGTFDGYGYTVSGVYINTTSDYQGLFGKVDGATIKNLSVTDSSITINITGTDISYVGGIVGYASGGSSSTIENCYNTGTVSGGSYVGGIVGYANIITIENCYNTATVSGGGIAGHLSSGNIKNVYNTGTTTGDPIVVVITENPTIIGAYYDNSDGVTSKFDDNSSYDVTGLSTNAITGSDLDSGERADTEMTEFSTDSNDWTFIPDDYSGKQYSPVLTSNPQYSYVTLVVDDTTTKYAVTETGSTIASYDLSEYDEDYYFVGWYSDDKYISEFDFDTVINDNSTTIYAELIKKTDNEVPFEVYDYTYGEYVMDNFSLEITYEEDNVSYDYEIYKADDTDKTEDLSNVSYLDAGEYVIYLTVGAYNQYNSVTVSDTFTVSPVEATIGLTDDIEDTITYGDDETVTFTAVISYVSNINDKFTLTFYNGDTELGTTEEFTIGGRRSVSSDDTTVTYEMTTSNAGDYEITAVLNSDSGNYTGTSNKAEFTVAPYEVTAVWTVEDEYTYTGEELTLPTATYVDLDGKTVELTVESSTSNDFMNAGEYEFTAVASDTNYTVSSDTSTIKVTVKEAPTPEPTATAVPTETPTPTETPAATATPEPQTDTPDTGDTAVTGVWVVTFMSGLLLAMTLYKKS